MNLKYTLFVIVAGLLGVAPAYGDLIEIVSEEGKSCTYEDGYAGGSSEECETVEIAPHNGWQPNNPEGRDAVWVSYDETGVDGDVVAPQVTTAPIFSIVESFEITGAGSIDFWIWADDTADLYFNIAGASLDEIFVANLSQGTCADGQIGCEPGEGFNLSMDLAAGFYDITMSIWQTGGGTTNPSNPFGVLYSGEVSYSVPEPGTLALLGIGLIGIGAARRRRKT